MACRRSWICATGRVPACISGLNPRSSCSASATGSAPVVEVVGEAAAPNPKPKGERRVVLLGPARRSVCVGLRWVAVGGW